MEPKRNLGIALTNGKFVIKNRHERADDDWLATSDIKIEKKNTIESDTRKLERIAGVTRCKCSEVRDLDNTLPSARCVSILTCTS